MGMYHSAYFAYGFRIDDIPAWVIEEKQLSPQEVLDDPEVHRDDRVGFLCAGDYDADMTFLVTMCESVDLGNYATPPLDITPERLALWNERLAWAVEHNKFTPHAEASWLFVPDMS